MKPFGWIDLYAAATLCLFALTLLTPTTLSQRIPSVPSRPTPRPAPTSPPEVEQTPLVEEESNKTKIVLTGDPQKDYIHDPNLPFELHDFDLSEYPFYKRVPNNIDESNFTCDDRFDGFYASFPHKCQVYHNCLFGIRYDFLCPNYTAFDQANLICNYYNVVDCDRAHLYYHRNEHLYIDPTTTTTGAPEVRIVYVERPHPRKRPANRGQPHQGLSNRQPPPPPRADDNYYDYVDETPPKTKAQTNNALNDDYYYYDDSPVLATTTRQPPPRRPQRTRPSRRRPPTEATTYRPRERLAGKLTHEELGLPPTEATTKRYVRERLAGKLTDEELGLTSNSERQPVEEPPRRRRPQRRRRKKKTTTTTAAPEYEYYDEYYDYYEDEPSTTTTTTTVRPKIIRRRKRPQVRRRRPTAEDRRQSLLRAKNSNSQFPSDLPPAEDVVPSSNPQEKTAPQTQFSPAHDEFIDQVLPRTTLDSPSDPQIPRRLRQRRPGEVPQLEESIFSTNDRVIAEKNPARRQGGFRRQSNATRTTTVQLSK